MMRIIVEKPNIYGKIAAGFYFRSFLERIAKPTMRPYYPRVKPAFLSRG
jgi:hypothetical protein